MDAKDKAKELVCKMYGCTQDTDFNDIYIINSQGYFIAKDSALVSCDFAKEFITGDLSESFDKFLYLEDVKEEINKL